MMRTAPRVLKDLFTLTPHVLDSLPYSLLQPSSTSSFSVLDTFSTHSPGSTLQPAIRSSPSTLKQCFRYTHSAIGYSLMFARPKCQCARLTYPPIPALGVQPTHARSVMRSGAGGCAPARMQVKTTSSGTGKSRGISGSRPQHDAAITTSLPIRTVEVGSYVVYAISLLRFI